MARNRWVGIAVAACWLAAMPQSLPAQPIPPPPGTPGGFLRRPSADAASTPATHPAPSQLLGNGLAQPLPTRHRGIGIPLQRTSWRNRPWYAGWQIGQLRGDDLVRGTVWQHSAVTGGYWLGYDFDHYWGAEMDWSFAYPRISDGVGNVRRSGRMVFWDVQLLHYPWGDARYRPYFKAGFGVTGVHFEDEQGRYFNRGLVTFPLGFGLKYFWKKWLALRLDITDHIAVGSGRVSSMHNWSFVGGIEWRFGNGGHVMYRP